VASREGGVSPPTNCAALKQGGRGGGREGAWHCRKGGLCSNLAALPYRGFRTTALPCGPLVCWRGHPQMDPPLRVCLHDLFPLQAQPGSEARWRRHKCLLPWEQWLVGHKQNVRAPEATRRFLAGS
jgi:hypothetical protein